jgi:hypothetical protein
MKEWEKHEDGPVDEAQEGRFVVRGIPLGLDYVVGAVSFGPEKRSLPTSSSSLLIPTKTTSKPTVESSAGYTEKWDFQILQELNDFIVTTITELQSLVDSFVCSVTATSKKGSQSNG